jgi:sugar (pentulose or hexulose) kinase
VVSEPVLVGLDVGTTAVKAAAFDHAGRELAQGRAATPWRIVPTGAEVDPGELLDAAVAAAREAVAAAGGGEVTGIGIASMAETGVLVDGRGDPVAPAIAWHDERGREEAERLARDLPDFARRVGLPPTELCTLVKYRWMREHVPASADGVRWLNVAEWIVYGLGGEPRAELSLASRTGFYDLHEQLPWDDALAWADAPAGLMPEAVPAGTPMGTATLPEAEGAVLTVGGHDHLAAAVGLGAAGEGDVLDSCGTAEAFVQASAPLGPEQVARAVAGGISVGWHAVPGRQALLGAHWSGARLRDALASFGIAPEERGPIEDAALAIERGDPGSPDAAAYHAALDEVGRIGADILAHMAAVAAPARRLVVTGGWAAGAAARAVKERRLGAFELSPALFSGGARGGALAAGRAARLWSVDDAPWGAVQEVT